MVIFSNKVPKKITNKLIFLHIPKTGGSSIETVLSQAFGKADIHHYSISQIQQRKLKDENVDEYKTFTVIRNPFERIISTWRQWVYHWDGYINEPYMNNHITPRTPFKEYVLAIKEYFDGNADVNEEKDSVHVSDKYGHLNQSHIETLNWWLKKNDGNLIKCDFLRFEDLSNEWDSYRHTLHIHKYNAELPHENKFHIPQRIKLTRNRDELYDEETYKVVSKIYKDEIRRFGYE